MAMPPCLSNDEKEKGKEKCLYFCVKKKNRTTDAGRRLSSSSSSSSSSTLDWYATDLSPSSDHEEEEEIRLEVSPTLKTMPPDAYYWGTVVALGSVIYHLGGCPSRNSDESPARRSANVFYFDTSRPDEGWKKADSMLASRLEPAAYGVDGNMYVFGGCYLGNFPYAEVFFPNIGWKPLTISRDPLPPAVIPVHADDYGRKRGSRRFLLIHLMGDDGYLYSFDLVFESWSLLDNKFGIWKYPLVAVGDLLYCYNGGLNFSAYDLADRMWFSNPIHQSPQPSSQVVVVDYPEFLLYIGNRKFCFISSNHPSDQLFITSTVVTVYERYCEEEETTSLVATIDSSTVYRVDGEQPLYCLAH